MILFVQRALLRMRIAYVRHRAESIALDVACLQHDLDQLPVTIEVWRRARLHAVAEERRLQSELAQLDPVARLS